MLLQKIGGTGPLLAEPFLPMGGSYAMLKPLKISAEGDIVMEYRFRPRGVCAKEMCVEVDDQGIVRELKVMGGCHGNLQGISALVKGMAAEEVVSRLRGIRCGFKNTSCPDQLAANLEQILAQR